MLSIDVSIFLIFLATNLLVGLFYSRGVTNIKQYAIGNRDFSTKALVSTIVASWIGAGFFSCTISEVYSQGLYYIIPALADSLGIIIIARVFIKRMGEFLGKLSIAEAMNDLFGPKVKLITIFSGIMLSLGSLGSQFKVAGNILEIIFGTSGIYATLSSAAIIILYSAFGGIKAVTFTDVVQFFTFGIIIPIMAIAIWDINSNQEITLKALSLNPSWNFTAIFDLDNPRLYKMIAMLPIFIPCFSPMFFQRIAMSSSIDQAVRAFTIAGIICFIVQCFIISISLLIWFDNPSLDPKTLINYIVNTYTQPGFKALFAIGIMAIIMSSADSLINSVSVIFAHDLCKPLGFKWSNNELVVSKVFAIFAGVSGVLFAIKFNTVLDLVVMSYGFYIAVVTPPFIFAILGFRSTQKSVLFGMIAGTFAFAICQFNLFGMQTSIKSSLVGMIANITFLFGSHYLLAQSGGWVGIKGKKHLDHYKANQKKQRSLLLQRIINFSFIKSCRCSLPEDENVFHYTGGLFCILIILNILTISSGAAVHGLNFWVIAASLAWSISFYFLIYPLLPEAYKRHCNFVSICWVFGMSYISICLPTILLIYSNFAMTQAIIFAISLIAVLMVFSYKAALLIIVSGFYFTCILMQNSLPIDRDFTTFINVSLIGISLLGVVLISFVRPKEEKSEKQMKIFIDTANRNKEMSQEVLNLVMMKQEFINNISHEIRTPLHHIGTGSEAIAKDWDKYSYEEKKEFAEIIYEGYKNASRYIDSLLDFSKLSTNQITLNFEKRNFVEIVEKSLDEFKDLYLKNQDLYFELDVDTENLEILCDEQKIKQVIINLLDNAAKYSKKGLINISVTSASLHNKVAICLAIRDNGVGIPENELVHIFGPFIQSSYTKTIAGGRGIGLSVCEKIINMHRGQIWAQNNQGNTGSTFYFIIPINNK